MINDIIYIISMKQFYLIFLLFSLFFAQIEDPCDLPIDNIFLTETGQVFYNSSQPISYIEFTLDNAVINNVNGGDSELYGFFIAFVEGNNVVSAFSLGQNIPEGCGVLLELELDGEATGISNIQMPLIYYISCNDPQACNYNPNATVIDNSSCLYGIDCLGECGGAAIIDCEGVCDGGVLLDCNGECGGSAQLDECGNCGWGGYNCEGIEPLENGQINFWNCPEWVCDCSDIPDDECDCSGNQFDCFGLCGGSAEFDECGICEGPGLIYECGCYDIPEGYCDCEGNINDECGECGGDGGIYLCDDGTFACDSFDCYGLNDSVITVDDDGPADFTTIQEAIDASVDGDIILVSRGFYQENLIINKNITLTSHFVYDNLTDLDSWVDFDIVTFEWTVYNESILETIIDGGNNGSVIQIYSEDECISPIIKGFTIQNGTGTEVIRNPGSELEEYQVLGGGILSAISNPIINYNLIKDNNSDSDCGERGDCLFSGGGMYLSSDPEDFGFDNRELTRNRCNIQEFNLANNMYSNNSAQFGNTLANRFYDNNYNMTQSIFDVANCQADEISPIWVLIEPEANSDISGSSANLCSFEGMDVYVDPNQDQECIINGCGEENNPFKTISWTLELIIPSELNPVTIHLANGDYSFAESGESFPIQLPPYVSIVGESREFTILDATNFDTVIELESQTSIPQRGNNISNLTIQGSSGAGALINFSNPSFSNVKICNNQGTGISINESDSNFYNCTISNNSRGISVYSGSPLIENVEIKENIIEYDEGFAAGIFIGEDALPTLRNVLIYDNEIITEPPSWYVNSFNYYSDGYAVGGGIYLEGDATFDNVSVFDNYAPIAGGVYIDGDMNIANLEIYNNDALLAGGVFISGSPFLENITIRNNTSSNPGSGLVCLDHYQTNPTFSETNRISIYNNGIADDRLMARDIFANNDNYNNRTLDIFLDTFTVMDPTSIQAFPIEIINFDIENAIQDQIENNLYVSPEGSDYNSGLSEQDPLKTIFKASSIIIADSLNSATIHLSNGVYSPSSNGEVFPISIPDYVTLDGESRLLTILDAEQQSKVIQLNNSTESNIRDVTITSGLSNEGAGISYYNSHAYLTNVSITENTITNNGEGGGIYNNNSFIFLDSVYVLNNGCDLTDGGSGAGILNKFGVIEMKNSIISNNSSAIGSGIYSINDADYYDYANQNGMVILDDLERNSIYSNPFILGEVIGVSELVLDTFTVSIPTVQYTLSNFFEVQSVDINTGILEQYSGDLYISPQNGSNQNSGSSFQDALQSIDYATKVHLPIEGESSTFYLDSGFYEPGLLMFQSLSLIGSGMDSTVLDFSRWDFGAANLPLIWYWDINPGTDILSDFTIQNANNGCLTIQGTYDESESVSLERIKIKNNYGCVHGGAIQINDINTNIEDCIIDNNIANERGGAIYSENSDLFINRTIISNNSVDWNGDGESTVHSVLFATGDVNIHNSIFYNNGNEYNYEYLGLIESSEIDIVNSILIGNSFSDYSIQNNNVSIKYSNIDFTNSELEDSNINVDPLFIDPENGDFRLQNDSPCIDAGTADTNQDGLDDIVDYLGSNPDIGAFEFICQSNIYDECGVCDGPGYNQSGCCGNDIPDCSGLCGGGLVFDACNVCGGDNSSCIDDCGIPNGDNISCSGCMDESALNYNPDSTINNDSCVYTINQDLWVSPTGDDNLNTGLDASSPFKTINYALWRIGASEESSHTIHLLEGIYSPSSNGESFPIEPKSYVNLLGAGKELTILDAEETNRVIMIDQVTEFTLSHMSIRNGIETQGGGIYTAYSSNLVLDNLLIYNNSAIYSGGGIYIRSEGSILSNIEVYNNIADYGGGIYMRSDYTKLKNVAIYKNHVSTNSNGGGIYCYQCDYSDFENVTITDNQNGIYFTYADYVAIVNSIIQDDLLARLSNGQETSDWSDLNYFDIIYSNIEGIDEGETNIDLPPLFTDIDNNDYNLIGNSPCVDSGTADIDQDGIDDIIDYFGSAPDMGAFELICESNIYDQCGICDGDDSSCLGCTDAEALNYSPYNFIDDGSCMYPIAQDIWVSPNGDDNLNTGLDASSPFKTINYALSVVDNPSEFATYTIHLSEGVYSPSTNGEVFPIIPKNYINIVGISKESTILDAEGGMQIFKMENTSGVALARLSVKNGTGYTGGGIYLNNARYCHIEDIYISNNIADYGGGIFIDDADCTIKNVLVSNNDSNNDGAGVYINAESYFPSIESLVVTNNIADDDGGGIYIDNSISSSELLVNVGITVDSNISSGDGGGIYLEGGNSNLIFKNSVIKNNEANNGGGLYLSEGGKFNGLELSHNHANLKGGAVYARGYPNFENATITQNTSFDVGGAIYALYLGNQWQLINSIIWNNSSPAIFSYGDVSDEESVITYSNVQDGFPGEGNIDLNPLFVDPDEDFHLQAGSPCIDSGTGDTNGDGVADILEYIGLAPDMGAFEFEPDNLSNDEDIIPVSFILNSPYPNPFNPSTTIEFEIPNYSYVSVDILDIRGRLISNLIKQYCGPGHYQVKWDGQEQSSGVYFVKMVSEDFVDTQKIMLIK